MIPPTWINQAPKDFQEICVLHNKYYFRQPDGVEANLKGLEVSSCPNLTLLTLARRGAKFAGCLMEGVLQEEEPKYHDTQPWDALFFKGTTIVSCKRYITGSLDKMTSEQISSQDKASLGWWKKNRDWVITAEKEQNGGNS